MWLDTFLPPSSLLSCLDSSWGAKRGSSRTDLVIMDLGESWRCELTGSPGCWNGVRDARMARIRWLGRCYTLLMLRIGNPSLIHWLFSYTIMHSLKACIRMVTWTYPILGDSLVDARSVSKVDDDIEGRIKDDSCFSQVCLWRKDIKMEDAQKPSYRFCVLFVYF